TWPAISASNGVPAKPIARIEAAIARTRSANQRRLRRTLATQRLARLLRALEAAIERAAANTDASLRHAESRRLMQRELSKRASSVLASGADLDHATPEALHALRIDAKKLRYRAELAATLYPNGAAHAYLRRITGVQSALGTLNDIIVGEDI